MRKNRTTIQAICQDYIRVGTQYFKKIGIPDKYGTIIPSLEKWTKQTIIDDYPKVKNAYENVPIYDAFCNVPDNTDEHREAINGCFNTYQKVEHQAAKGEIKTTLKFLKHIYGEKLDVGLDYLTVLWRYPKQKLPIHCLVSKQRKTGKTTFLEWLTDIYQTNATILSNEDFQTGFNAHFASKLIIGIDETFIDAEKKKEAERIKQMSTGGKIHLQYKGVDSRQIDFYGKLMMNSNNETDFVPIDAQENRYFIIKVHTLEEEIPDIRDLLREEIPAFLHFLNTREIKHPKKTRTWFEDKDIITAALKAVVRDTKPTWQKVIDDFIEECFAVFEEEALEFTPKDIYMQIRDEYKYISKHQIQKYLKDVRGMQHEGMIRYELYNLGAFYMQGGESPNINFCKKTVPGRAYKFLREEWVHEPMLKVAPKLEKSKNGEQKKL